MKTNSFRTNIIKLSPSKTKKTRTITEVRVETRLPKKKLTQEQITKAKATDIKRIPKVNKLPQTKKAMTHRIKEPDIFITILQNVIAESGMKTVDIAAKAFLGFTTIDRIVENKTSRPQNYTCEAILKACGYERLVKKRNLS